MIFYLIKHTSHLQDEMFCVFDHVIQILCCTQCTHFPCCLLGSLFILLLFCSFFLSFSIRPVIYSTSVCAEPYILSHSFQQNITLMNTWKMTTFFLFHPHWNLWIEIGRKFLLIFHLCFAAILFIFVCYMFVLVFCCAIEFHLLSLRKKTEISKHWLLAYR